MRDRFLIAACAFYALAFTALGSLKYAVHRNFVDFGIFAQTAASAFGCFCNSVEGSHWAFHFSPILYVAGIAVWLVRSPYTLIALQSVACALALPPVYGLVRRRSDVYAARLATLTAMLFPALAGLTFNDFHENDFAPAAVLWAIWAFDGGYVRAATAFAIAALCVKEDQTVFFIFAGAAAYIRFRGTAFGRTGLVVAALATAVAVEYFTHIQPAAAAHAHWAPVRFYAWTPGDLHDVFFSGIASRAGFFVLAFAPLLFLPFRSRLMWLAALPLAEVVLSRMPTTFTLGSHYAGAWVGWVLAAFAFAVRALPPQRARTALRWCVALCVVEFLVANPLHPGLNVRPIEARDRQLDAAIEALPARIAVSTQEEAYTHWAMENPNATVLPEEPSRRVATPFVLVDRDFPKSPRLVEYESALVPPCFVQERADGAIVIYRALCAGASSSSKPATARSGH